MNLSHENSEITDDIFYTNKSFCRFECQIQGRSRISSDHCEFLVESFLCPHIFTSLFVFKKFDIIYLPCVANTVEQLLKNYEFTLHVEIVIRRTNHQTISLKSQCISL